MSLLEAPRPPLDTSTTEQLGARSWFGLLLAAVLLAAADLHGIDRPVARFAATALVAAVLAPHIYQWWRTPVGVAVFGTWVVLSLSNLSSPLRSTRSMLDLATAVLSVVLVVQIARLVGSDRVRRYLTAYLTALLSLALVVKAASALVAGSLSLTDLRVDTSAAGMWKALVILSPCPTRWVPARLGFVGFKVLLVFLMLTVDRPKIGVLLAMAFAITVGALAILLHRAARTRNVMLMCFTILPVAIVPALVLGNWMVKVYVRRSDYSGRTVLWQAAVDEVAQTRSILGVGFRNSLTSADAVATLSARFGEEFESGGNAVHNVYLQFFVEFGLVGVALVAVALTAAIVGLVRIRSVSMQTALAVDLLFVLGLCLAEPVFEPNRVIFVLICLTMVRIREQAAVPLRS